MSVYLKPRARDLPCVLRVCETKESQVWRHAILRKQLALYHTYVSELCDFEKHYNQVIATNKFCQHLIGSNQENKRSRLIQMQASVLDTLTQR